MANASFSLLNPPLNAGTNEWITLSFDEDVTGLLFSEISVVGGTIVGTAFDSSSTADTYYFQVSVPSGNGRVTISIAENVVAEGNPATSQSFDYGTGPQDATLTISTTETDLYAGKTFDINITSDLDISNFALSDVTVTGGTANSLTETDARNFVLNVTAGAAGTLNVDIAEDVVSPGNAAVDQDFTIVALDALTVAISGTTNIEQGGTTTLSAAVTNPDRLTITSGLTYAWTASRGSFPNGATGASVTYEADFTESSDVDVDITCTVTRTADASPTVSTGSLTAMADLGITGQILNMYITETEASSNGSNKVIYAAGSDDSALADGSDDDITNAINTWRVQYHPSNDWLILNNDGSGDLNAFFENNTTQSVYLIFSDGEYYEITNARYDNGGTAWCRWDVTAISALATKLDAIGADDTLLVGVGNAGSVGYIAGSGSGTTQVTATAAAGLASAPQNLTATADANGTRIDLDWDAPSDNGGSAITEYEYRYAEGTSVPSGTTWTETDSTDTAITITGLSKGTEYTFEVRAVNANGSGTSASVTQTTQTTVPNAPTGLSVTVTRTTATLSWTAPSDNGGTAITGYQYRYQEGSTVGGTWTDTDSTDTTFTVTGLDANTEYTFEVRAVNSQGQSTSNPSVTETTENLTVPSPPENLMATADANGTEMGLDWDAPSDNGGSAITGYQYRYQEGSSVGGTWTNTDSTTTAFTVTGLEKGTQYTFQVRAVNSQGQSTSNPSITETTETTAPGPPTNLTATADANGTEMDLSWTAPTDDGGSAITEYQYRYQAGTSAGGVWTDTDSTSTTFTVTGLDKGTEYTFQVRTVTAVDTSTSNPSVTETTETTVPDAPTNLAVTHTHEEATITWENPTDTGGSALTDIELRITTGSTPGGTWQSLGVVETHTESGLTAETEYTAEIRAENAEGYSTTVSVTFTTNAASMFSITPAGPFIITIGAMDYSQPITITGTTADTNVTLEGDWEGFYMDWDQSNDTLYIKSDEVTRLVGEYVWLITASEGSDTATEEIIYSVIPAAPIITPITDTQVIYRGDEAYIPFEILNTPDVASIEGLQVGMKYVASEDEAIPGLTVTGTLPEAAILTETTFMAKVMAENAAGRVESMVPFAVRDIDYENFFVADRDETVIAIDKQTAIGTTPSTTPVDYVENYTLDFVSVDEFDVNVENMAVHRNTLFCITAIGAPSTISVYGKTNPSGRLRYSFTVDDILVHLDGTRGRVGAIAIYDDYLYVLWRTAFSVRTTRPDQWGRIALSDIEADAALSATDFTSITNLPTNNFAYDIAVDNTYLYYIDIATSGTYLRRYNYSTQTLSTGRMNLDSAHGNALQGIAVDEDYIYYATDDGNRIIIYDKSALTFALSNTAVPNSAILRILNSENNHVITAA